jgi:hypothetical protein
MLPVTNTESQCGGSFAAAIAGFICQSAPAPATDPAHPGRTCDWCGVRRAGGPPLHWFWDPKVTIPFEDLPHCNWRQQLSSGKVFFSNHYPAEFRPGAGRTQRIGLFRDPRRRLVSAWNSHKHGAHPR